MIEPDVLIAGSGPAGSSFARIIHERVPHARILMVDVGPRLTEGPGMHVKNIADPRARALAQRRSQGIPETRDHAPATSDGDGGIVPRLGTFLVDRRASREASRGMPAAAMSSNVGGMGAHWTCASPRPDRAERASFIRDDEWEAALTKAEQLLAVSTDAFSASWAAPTILRALRAEYADLPEGRRVRAMPLACVASNGKRHWTGADTVLGPLVAGDSARFTLRSDTLCRRLIVDGSRVAGALLRDVRTGADQIVRPRFAVVAADAFRTPQLLWASGIRPPGLGRYLNEHIQLVSSVVFRGRPRGETHGDPTIGVFWVPFSPEHPFHGQVMHFDLPPRLASAGVDDLAGASVVSLAWFLPKEIRDQDRVKFLDDRDDEYGMPAIAIDYELTSADRRTIDAAICDQLCAARTLGEHTDDGQPQVLPAGSSLHYQGTVRMGPADDGTSVCDPYAQVWGIENLFVGGNGVIPTATASNPTLTSVALAIRSAQRIAMRLGHES